MSSAQYHVCFSCSPPAAEYALIVNCQFGQPYFTVLAYGILGKGRLFLTPSLEDCLTRLMGSSTQAGTGCSNLQLIGRSVAYSQALTWPQYHKVSLRKKDILTVAHQLKAVRNNNASKSLMPSVFVHLVGIQCLFCFDFSLAMTSRLVLS